MLDYSEIFKCMEEWIFFKENTDFKYSKKQSKMYVSLSAQEPIIQYSIFLCSLPMW